jgi:molecular chaperone Hsp33
MTPQDQLLRFNFDYLDIRGELVYLQHSWQQVLARYDYPVNVQQQLGIALAALVLLSATIKFDGHMILQVQGNGPLKKLVVQVTHDGAVRGLARWEGLVPAGSLAEVFGEGMILITVFKASGEPYQSIVAMEGYSLADALNVYFMQSEQLPSTFRLLATPTTVVGFFLQQLPDSRSNLDTLNDGKDRDEDWNRVNYLAATLADDELLELPADTLLMRLFHEEEVRLHAPKALHFACTCSRHKVEGTLISLGRAELDSIIAAEKQIDVDCEFCNQRYSFTAHDVAKLFEEGAASSLPADAVLH